MGNSNPKLNIFTRSTQKEGSEKPSLFGSYQDTKWEDKWGFRIMLAIILLALLGMFLLQNTLRLLSYMFQSCKLLLRTAFELFKWRSIFLKWKFSQNELKSFNRLILTLSSSFHNWNLFLQNFWRDIIYSSSSSFLVTTSLKLLLHLVPFNAN